MLANTIRRAALWCPVALVTSVAVACSDGSSPKLKSELTGTAALGAPIVNGAVSLKCQGGVTHSATTNATGGWTASVQQDALPCAVRISGGTAGSGGPTNSQTLYSITTDTGSAVTTNVTPLTDLVLSRAVHGASNQALSAWFNGNSVASGIEAILPAVQTAATALKTALTSAGYAWPAGAFDPFSTTFSPSAGNAYDDLLEAIGQAIQNSGGTYDAFAATFASTGSGVPSKTTPGTVHASLVGEYVLKFYQGGGVAGAPYDEEEVVEVVVGSDNSLTVGGKKLTNPYFKDYGSGPHKPELIWVDAQAKLAYALSDNETGTFNEINLGDMAELSGPFQMPAFLGQLRTFEEEEEEGPEPDESGAAALGDDNGVTGKLGETTHTFKSNVGLITSLDNTTGVFTAFAAQGASFDPLTRWDISGIPLTVGTHTCKTNGVLPNIQLTLSGTIYNAAPQNGRCIIKVTHVGGGEIEGSFTATLVTLSGGTHSVTEGYFKFRLTGDGGGGALPAGEQGGSFDVGETTYRYPRATALPFETYGAVTIAPGTTETTSPGYPQGVQLHGIPNSLGSYACGSGPAYRGVNMWFWWMGKWYYAGSRGTQNTAGPEGSSCTITLTKVGTIAGFEYEGTFEGTFSGTFVADNGDKVTVANGKFRYISPEE